MLCLLAPLDVQIRAYWYSHQKLFVTDCPGQGQFQIKTLPVLVHLRIKRLLQLRISKWQQERIQKYLKATLEECQICQKKLRSISVKILFWSGNRFWLSWFLQVAIVNLQTTNQPTTLKLNNNFVFFNQSSNVLFGKIAEQMFCLKCCSTKKLGGQKRWEREGIDKN